MKILRETAVLVTFFVKLMMPELAMGTEVITSEKPSSAALKSRTIGLDEFANEVLQIDPDYQSAIIDQKIAEVQKSVADSLWRNTLEVTPYLLESSVAGIPATGAIPNFTEKGIQWGVSQFTPWGTQFRLGLDQVIDNNRSGTFNKEQGLNFSLSQPLWKNQFGETLRRQQNQLEHQAKATQLNRQLKLQNACLRATTAYVSAWSIFEKHRFVLEAVKMSEDLFQKGSSAVKRGQMSQLDWLGIQSDHLNLNSARTTSEQALNQSLSQLEEMFPSARGRALENPEDLFIALLKPIKQQDEPKETLTEKYQAEVLKGLEEQMKFERSKSLPVLDLKLSQKWDQGTFGVDNYRQAETAASLNFVWSFNDPSVEAPLTIAQLQSRKATLLLDHLKQQRNPHFQDQKAKLLRLEKQISLEIERSRLLAAITQENRKRFLQGRLEFQMLLRIKEQWLESEQKIIENRSQFWKSLLEFALQQELPVSFCGGHP